MPAVTRSQVLNSTDPVRRSSVSEERRAQLQSARDYGNRVGRVRSCGRHSSRSGSRSRLSAGDHDTLGGYSQHLSRKESSEGPTPQLRMEGSKSAVDPQPARDTTRRPRSGGEHPSFKFSEHCYAIAHSGFAKVNLIFANFESRNIDFFACLSNMPLKFGHHIY